jgi:hypothetical protein
VQLLLAAAHVMGGDSRARQAPHTGAAGDGDHPTQAAVPGHNAAPKSPGHSTPPVQVTHASMDDERGGEYGAVAVQGVHDVAPMGPAEKRPAGHGVQDAAMVDPVGLYVPAGHSVEMVAKNPAPTIGTSLVMYSEIAPVHRVEGLRV